MVAFSEPRTDAFLFGQFERRLEEIHKEACDSVKTSERFDGGDAIEPTVPDHPTDNQSILLLDPCLVVPSVWPTSGELDALLLVVLEHHLVDKFPAVVRVDALQDEREGWAAAARWLPPQGCPGERGAERPQSSHSKVGQRERMSKAAA